MTIPTPPSVPRERVTLRLLPDLVQWACDEAGEAGVFGSYSHAVERALARLRHEHAVIQRRCKAEKMPFRKEAYWSLYAADLDAVPLGKDGPRFKDGTPNPPLRLPAPATVSVGLLVWARDHLVEEGPFATMNRAVEVGLRRLRQEGPVTVGVPGDPFQEEAWWQRYRQALAGRDH